MSAVREERRPLPRRLLRRLPVVLWLWLLWVLLWSTPTALVVTGGLLVAVGVVAAFPMPEVSRQAAVRPLQLLRLTVLLFAELVGSAVSIAWAAVRHGPRVRAAVVEIPLTADSDLLVTGTALLTTMTPGSLVLEIDRPRRLLYVHVLPVNGQEEVEAERRRLHRAEAKVWHALAREPARRDGNREGEGEGEDT
ncbi:Na+/H+ antiporter subunit E [Streptomyces sp. TRM 70351]|uniref:Na+/H+ antiporter subunit E n=1 Tax=Streptomyces sp. TRM 70351 TaxID=3116552 RepID=UPI002E7C0AB8|nr:Na+/H+ antiporter subunit E [Streptomyces sp. TRM 70351]MEE1929544.1 Na+/H+ antiporter subunit E [Streptomyces sp. TRM 70351]